jgi:small subunit ribosomal protein S1
LTIGETVNVSIIKINQDTQRISLGMKQLEADPWEGVVAKYPLDAKFTGRVTNITDYGAFVELEPGVEGLVHVSEMSWVKKNVHPGKIVSTSQEVEVMVLEVDQSKRRMSLGLKQCMDNPWTTFAETYPVGTEIEGEIKNITEFGLFVGLEDDLDGMVHMSDLDWNRSGDEAMADYKKGDMVKAVILDVDMEKERISLGIKQLTGDPMESVGVLKRGSVVTCTVTHIQDNGIEVEVGEGFQAFIRRGDLSRDRSEQRPERFAVGDKIDAKVTNIDKANRKIGLSIRAHEMAEEKEAVKQYGSSDSGATLGDILGSALSKAQDDTDPSGDEALVEASEPEAEEAPESAADAAEEPAEEAEAEAEAEAETEAEADVETAEEAATTEASETEEEAEEKKPAKKAATKKKAAKKATKKAAKKTTKKKAAKKTAKKATKAKTKKADDKADD